MVRNTALAYVLAFRGHVREATEMIRRGEVRPRSKPLEGTLALLGLPPSERGDLFAQWLAGSGFMRSIVALPWWGAQRDTLALAEFGRRVDSMAATRGNVMIQHGADLARAFHAVAAGDSAAALEQLLTFADSLCLGGGACSDERLMTVSLLTTFGRYEEAGQRLLPEVRGWIRDFPHPVDVLWELERGRVFERLRDSDRAIASYSFVVEAWTAGDPEVQEFVDEARAGLSRLTAEPTAR